MAAGAIDRATILAKAITPSTVHGFTGLADLAGEAPKLAYKAFVDDGLVAITPGLHPEQVVAVNALFVDQLPNGRKALVGSLVPFLNDMTIFEAMRPGGQVPIRTTNALTRFGSERAVIERLGPPGAKSMQGDDLIQIVADERTRLRGLADEIEATGLMHERGNEIANTNALRDTLTPKAVGHSEPGAGWLLLRTARKLEPSGLGMMRSEPVNSIYMWRFGADEASPAREAATAVRAFSDELDVLGTTTGLKLGEQPKRPPKYFARGR